MGVFWLYCIAPATTGLGCISAQHFAWKQSSSRVTCAWRPGAAGPASTEHQWPKSRPWTGRAPGCCRAGPAPGWSETTRSSTGTPETLTCWWRRGWWEVPAEHRAGTRTPHPESGRWTLRPGPLAPARRPWRIFGISGWACSLWTQRPLHLRLVSVSTQLQSHKLSKQQGATTSRTLNAAEPFPADRELSTNNRVWAFRSRILSVFKGQDTVTPSLTHFQGS